MAKSDDTSLARFPRRELLEVLAKLLRQFCFLKEHGHLPFDLDAGWSLLPLIVPKPSPSQRKEDPRALEMALQDLKRERHKRGHKRGVSCSRCKKQESIAKELGVDEKTLRRYVRRWGSVARELLMMEWSDRVHNKLYAKARTTAYQRFEASQFRANYSQLLREEMTGANAYACLVMTRLRRYYYRTN